MVTPKTPVVITEVVLLGTQIQMNLLLIHVAGNVTNRAGCAVL